MDGRSRGWTDVPEGGRTCPRVDERAQGWKDVIEGGRTYLRLIMSSISGGMSLSLLLLSTRVSRFAILVMFSGSFSSSFLCSHNVCSFSILRTDTSHCILAAAEGAGLRCSTITYLCMSSGKCCRRFPPMSSHSSAGSATTQSGRQLKSFMDRSRCCSLVRFLSWSSESKQTSD